MRPLIENPFYQQAGVREALLFVRTITKAIARPNVRALRQDRDSSMKTGARGGCSDGERTRKRKRRRHARCSSILFTAVAT